MAPDGVPTPGSAVPTPLMTPMPSGMNTPLPHQNGGSNGTLGDYLSAPLGKGGHLKAKTYLAGSKALDSLAKLIASTEGFFHPTNSGSWTNDVRHTLPFLGGSARSYLYLHACLADLMLFTVERLRQIHCLRLQQT